MEDEVLEQTPPLPAMEDHEVLEQTPPLPAMEDHEVLEQMPLTEDILEVYEEVHCQLRRKYGEVEINDLPTDPGLRISIIFCLLYHAKPIIFIYLARACISRFKDCPLCGADIEKIEPDKDLQDVVDRFIEGHARIKRSQVDTNTKRENDECKTSGQVVETLAYDLVLESVMYLSYTMNVATPTRDFLKLVYELLVTVVKARTEKCLTQQELTLVPQTLILTATPKRCRSHMAKTDEFMSSNTETLLMDPMSISTSYIKMKNLCSNISNEIKADINIHNQHILPSSIDLSNIASAVYNTQLFKRLTSFLAILPPSSSSPHVTELLIATADFERDLELWKFRPVHGGVDSRKLFHNYIMVWVEDKQLSLLDLCKAKRNFRSSVAYTIFGHNPYKLTIMMMTVMNSVIIQSALEKLGVQTHLQTAFQMHGFAEPYSKQRAIRHLEKGRVVIFDGIGAGTGNPILTTDAAAALRASELNAEAVLKGTSVDSVYDFDSRNNNSNVAFGHSSLRELASRGITFMDLTALTFCEDNGVPVVVFNLLEPGNISRALCGDQVGTLVDKTGNNS
ncbi:hypothetical protein GIB67_031027 [Kingdonia uniflora]|uniref:Aspartate/glutamate/uridylate kinase domain-containing protein n=1 Tax=Kingdonia uniflora TaxID=39325 RepID=A0A7J7NGQ1_9MAGN|nr:hypothetical protein GIB67_031027 [Kingdonia uniflora]